MRSNGFINGPTTFSDSMKKEYSLVSPMKRKHSDHPRAEMPLVEPRRQGDKLEMNIKVLRKDGHESFIQASAFN